MKDLIFITAYCPSDEQIAALEKCVDSVLKTGYHILLVSHSHIPIHIQKKCNYYIYDYLNDVSYDYNLFGNNYFAANDICIHSKFFQKSFYGFAIYRMFSIASQLAANYGYKNLHHIEYDCELIDKNIITEHSELLETWNSILYTDTGTEEGFIFGSLKSFRVEFLPHNFKNYNKDFIESEMRRIEPKHLETLTKKLFVNSRNVLFRDSNKLVDEKFKRGPKFLDAKRYYNLFYNEKDKKLYVYYRSMTHDFENIVIIINDTKIVRMEIEPLTWYIKELDLFDEINYVRIDNTKKTLFEQYFDNEFKEIFKKNSYITFNEKDS